MAVEGATLRDQLAEAVRASSTEATEVLPAQIIPGPKEEPAVDVSRETDEQKAQRARDEKGRFAAKPESAAEPSKAPLTPPPAKAAAEAPPAVPPVNAPARPSSWKKEHWGAWDELAKSNPTLAAYLGEREQQYAKGVSTYKQEWEQAKPLIDALEPYRPLLQQQRIDPARLIADYGHVHQTLATGSPQDKLAMVQRIISSNNIPVALAVQGQDGQWQLMGQQQQQQADPQTAWMAQRLQQLEGTLTGYLSQQKQQQQTLINSEIDTFKVDKPHFEEVKGTMAQLLESGVAQDLNSAYDKALRLHDDIWSAEQAAKQAADQKSALEAKTQAAQRAKSAAVSTRSATPSGAVPTNAGKSLRDTIAEATANAVSGRV